MKILLLGLAAIPLTIILGLIVNGLWNVWLLNRADRDFRRFADWYRDHSRVTIRYSILGLGLVDRAIRSHLRLRSFLCKWGFKGFFDEQLSLLYELKFGWPDRPPPRDGLPNGGPSVFIAQNPAPFS